MQWPAPHAARNPDKAAYVLAPSDVAVTYQQLNERSNQLARLLASRGLGFGDHLAILMENTTAFLEVCWAAQRSGLYFTPINYHFTARRSPTSSTTATRRRCMCVVSPRWGPRSAS